MKRRLVVCSASFTLAKFKLLLSSRSFEFSMQCGCSVNECQLYACATESGHPPVPKLENKYMLRVFAKQTYGTHTEWSFEKEIGKCSWSDACFKPKLLLMAVVVSIIGCKSIVILKRIVYLKIRKHYFRWNEQLHGIF